MIDDENKDYCIYLNLRDDYNKMKIVRNVKSSMDRNSYEEMITKYGYEPIVFDSDWKCPKFNEYEEFLGRGNLSFDSCIKTIDHIVDNIVEEKNGMEIHRAILALDLAIKNTRGNDYKECSERAIKICKLCVNCDRPGFITLLERTLPCLDKLSIEYCHEIQKIAINRV